MGKTGGNGVKHKDDRVEKALEEAYEEIKKLKEFQIEVSMILGTTRKPMLEEIRELKHRADVAEEALRELIAEMYENGIRPICNQEMLYETRLEQSEQRLKERV